MICVHKFLNPIYWAFTQMTSYYSNTCSRYTAIFHFNWTKRFEFGELKRWIILKDLVNGENSIRKWLGEVIPYRKIHNVNN